MLKKLENNPNWKKVELYSKLQDIFLIGSLFCAIMKLYYFDHWFWAVFFLILGVLSLVFGAISMNIFRKHFAKESDDSKQVLKGN